MVFNPDHLPFYLTAMVAQGESLCLLLNRHNVVIDDFVYDGITSLTRAAVNNLEARKIVIISHDRFKAGVPEQLVSIARNLRMECDVYAPANILIH